MRRSKVATLTNMVANVVGNTRVESTDDGVRLCAEGAGEAVEIDLTCTKAIDTAVAILLAAVPSAVRGGYDAEWVFDEFARRAQERMAEMGRLRCECDDPKCPARKGRPS